MSDNRRKTFKGLSSQTIITITMGMLGIAYFSIMSRLLTQEDFGYFAIITAITSIFASLTEAGLGAAVIQCKDANTAYVHTALSLSIILGIIMGGCLFCASSFFSDMMLKSDTLIWGYRIMSFSLILYSINSVGRATIMKKLKFLQYGIYSILAYGLSCIIGILMAYYGYGYYSTIAAMFSHQLFLSFFLFGSNVSLIGFCIDCRYVKRILSYGGWLTGSVIVRNISHQIDKLITTSWIPVSMLGAYNRPAGFISEITGHLNGIFDTILFPILSGINDDYQKINSAYEKTVSLITIFSVFMTGIFVLGAEAIINIFLGKKWVYLTGIFQIISLSIIFLCYGRLADCFFRSLGIVKSFFYTRCCVFVCTCLCVYLGCQYGIRGLAIGLVFSRFADTFIKIIFLHRHIKLPWFSFYETLLKGCFIPFALLVMCYVIMLNLTYGCVISTTLFVVCIVCVGTCCPKWLGDIYYNDIYVPINNKLRILLHQSK